MSTYSNSLQPALQNLLQRVVRFFHPRSSCTLHDDAYIGRCSENNIKCVVHDDLGWKNQTTRYILPRHWLYEWFSQFHSCGTYSVLSRTPSSMLSGTAMQYLHTWVLFLKPIHWAIWHTLFCRGVHSWLFVGSVHDSWISKQNWFSYNSPIMHL